jgi:hypothetical protein
MGNAVARLPRRFSYHKTPKMGWRKHVSLVANFQIILGKLLDEHLHLLLEIMDKSLQLSDLGLKSWLPLLHRALLQLNAID